MEAQKENPFHEPVLLRIYLKNESAKHYFSLDNKDLSLYPDEQEILLQAGMISRIMSYEKKNELHIFSLESSEKLVK